MKLNVVTCKNGFVAWCGESSRPMPHQYFVFETAHHLSVWVKEWAQEQLAEDEPEEKS